MAGSGRSGLLSPVPRPRRRARPRRLRRPLLNLRRRHPRRLRRYHLHQSPGQRRPRPRPIRALRRLGGGTPGSLSRSLIQPLATDSAAHGSLRGSTSAGRRLGEGKEFQDMTHRVRCWRRLWLGATLPAMGFAVMASAPSPAAAQTAGGTGAGTQPMSPQSAPPVPPRSKRPVRRSVVDLEKEARQIRSGQVIPLEPPAEEAQAPAAAPAPAPPAVAGGPDAAPIG